MMSARWAQPRLRPLMLALAALALVGVGARAAQAGDGAQFSGDCNSTYVNKKVGSNEQWAITWELFGSASGNVFKLDGSPPSFIECVWQDEDDTNEIFNCYGASACSTPPCGNPQWSLIAANLKIATTFFLPPGVTADDPYSACDLREDN